MFFNFGKPFYVLNGVGLFFGSDFVWVLNLSCSFSVRDHKKKVCYVFILCTALWST